MTYTMRSYWEISRRSGVQDGIHARAKASRQRQEGDYIVRRNEGYDGRVVSVRVSFYLLLHTHIL